MNLFSCFHVRFAARRLALASVAAALLASPAWAGNWIGYMNVFNNSGVAPVGGQGSYVFGDFWGVPDIKTTVVTSNLGTIIGDQLILEPNYNTYTNSLGGSNGDRAFWTNSSDGGATAGPYGNKWMDANTFVETNPIAIPSYTFDGTVTANSLNTSLYTAEAFIKVLDPSAGYSTVLNNRVTLPASGPFSLTSDLTAFQGKLLQVGFTMSGLNANIADAGTNGSVSVTVVPEPSTIAGLATAGMCALVVGLRRRRAAK